MKYIKVSNANINNLKNISLSIPCNNLIAFIGKSGSGKSTLAVDVIYAAYLKENKSVNVYGTASLFKQISSLNNQKSSISKYLLGITLNNKTLSQIDAEIKSDKLRKTDIKKIICTLELSDINMSTQVCKLSMSTYNKIRFLKMLLTKTSDVLIIDELASGLSYKDASAIGSVYTFLVEKGYTIIAIEHSLAVIEQSDYIVEMGPEAGAGGGEILFSGTSEEYFKTERWALMNREQNMIIPVVNIGKRNLKINDINYNNLSHINIKIPTNAIVNICGGTAAGKTSILDIIYRALDKSADAWKNRYGIDGDIVGKNNIRRAYVIDQSPVGKNSMSSIGTYSGIMDSIRKIYSTISMEYDKAYSASDFSYNGKYGCEKCSGRGYFNEIIDENEIFSQCDSCHGKRFKKEILTIKDHGLDIGDFLQTPCDKLYEIYSDRKKQLPVTKKIGFINDVGLSYVCLGQPSGTLSGGESQRLKITKELAKKLGDRCVFILDNPTKGLHVMDCRKLLNILRHLVEKNNSIIISDNNPFMINNSDYLILLENGKLVFEGNARKLSLKHRNYFGIKD